MNDYKYDYMKEADANIVLDAYSRDYSDRVHLEIVNFSFAPVTYLLKEILNEGRLLGEMSLTVHHFRDLEQSDFAQRLSDFSEALKNQRYLRKFSLTQKSLKINDAIVDGICSGLVSSEQLSALGLQGLVSDKGAEMIANFLKEMPCLATLYLQENAIGDKGAAQLIEAAHYSRYLSIIDFGLNNLTDRSISAILAAPRLCHVKTLGNQITSSGQQLLKRHRKHADFLNHYYHEQFQLFKQPPTAKNMMRRARENLTDILLSAPEREYKETQSGEFEFSESPTQQLSLQQLLIADPKLWEIPCENEHEDKSTPKIYKDILICAYSATLHNFIFSSRFVPGILYWQGDPHHFGTVCDSKFTPATAAEVEELLERARPAEAHRYWVIDEKRWRETLVAADRHLNDFDFFPTEKEVDLRPHAFYMADDLFRKIARGISNITTQMELAGCHHLNPVTLCQVLHQFPRLQFLGLRQAKPWGAELKTLTQTCPYLEELEICIDTAAPLEMLSKFHYLRRLYLDLSGNLQLRNLNFLKDCGDRVTLLKLSGCTNLTDLTGLKYCPNLEEIWFEKMTLVDFKGLIQQLGQLNGLTLLAFHECQYSADSQLHKLIRQCLPHTHISPLGTVVNTIKTGETVDENFLIPTCETDIPDSDPSFREMTCNFSYSESLEKTAHSFANLQEQQGPLARLPARPMVDARSPQNKR